MAGVRLVKTSTTGVDITFTARSSLLVEDVVFATLDRIRREHMVQFMAARVLLCPHTNSLEHVTLNVNALVAESWMVECAKNIVYHLVDGDIGIIPCKQNSSATC